MAVRDDVGVACFPRWRVMARTYQRAEGWITNRLGALTVLVILTVLVGGVVGAAIGTTTLAALVGALAALVLLLAGRSAFELARYWYSGMEDDTWQALAESTGDGHLRFRLARKVGTPPEFVMTHGTMECIVQTPIETRRITDQELFAPKGAEAIATLEGMASGTYEVRWYGSRRGKFYEITRGRFTLDVSKPQWLSASTDLPFRRWRIRSGGDEQGSALTGESRGELGQDRQVGVEPDTADTANPEGE
jgi:hypothetical protein